ncbi:MAG: glycosyltransferase 87 family protein [Rhodospirillales bacterium]|nr:glycosyltransferase 87 family protein [Rhodospirillales bacterium]
MRRAGGPALIGLVLIGAALMGLDVAALGLHVPGALGIGSNQRLRAFVGLMMVEMALYGGAVWIVLRAALPPRTVSAILAAALLMRGILLFSPPFLSSDLHRYVWDGMVQAAGINPYRYRPDAPALAFLRDRSIYPGINRKATARTIYPPFAEAVFALAARLSPTLFAMKAVMTAFDLIGIAALLRLLRRAHLPAARILIYAWQPLPIWEFAGNGHVDAIVVGCTAVALLAAAAGRKAFSAVAFAGAVLAKLLPVALMPALWRPRGWRFPLLSFVMIAAFYAAFAGVGWRVLGFLPGYIRQEGIASGLGIFYLDVAGRLVRLSPFAGRVYLGAAAIVLAGLGLAIWRRDLPEEPAQRTRRIAADAGLLATALMLVLTPHYPWYFAWLLVPLCIQPSPAVLYLPAASFLLYLDPLHTRPIWPALIYVPFAVLAVVSLAWRRRRRKAAGLLRNNV